MADKAKMMILVRFHEGSWQACIRLGNEKKGSGATAAEAVGNLVIECAATLPVKIGWAYIKERESLSWISWASANPEKILCAENQNEVVGKLAIALSQEPAYRQALAIVF